MTPSHCWWGWLNKFWLVFYHLYDIPRTQLKSENNRFANLGDYLYKNRHRQTIDMQTEKENLRFHCLGVMKRRKNIKITFDQKIKNTQLIAWDFFDKILGKTDESHMGWLVFTSPVQRLKMTFNWREVKFSTSNTKKYIDIKYSKSYEVIWPS